jgi:rare lipoprotein A
MTFGDIISSMISFKKLNNMMIIMKKIFSLSAILTSIVLLMSFSAPPAEVGTAIVYDDSYQGRKTACDGETYDKNQLTAAHKTLPCGTMVKVTFIDKNKSVIVKINDRGPYMKGQVLMVSRKAAVDLGVTNEAEFKVKIEVISGPNDRKKEAAAKIEPKIGTKPARAKEPELNIIQEAAKMETGGLYKMQVLKLEPKGFGVQVAGYSDYESVVQQVAVLQENWFKGAMVFVDHLNGKAYYKIIMGPFFTKEEADSYCNNLKKKYNVKDAFVVALDQMKASK